MDAGITDGHFGNPQAIKELGYEPNLNAQRLAGARDERTVALLLPRLDFDVALRIECR